MFDLGLSGLVSLAFMAVLGGVDGVADVASLLLGSFDVLSMLSLTPLSSSGELSSPVVLAFLSSFESALSSSPTFAAFSIEA